MYVVEAFHVLRVFSLTGRNHHLPFVFDTRSVTMRRPVFWMNQPDRDDGDDDDVPAPPPTPIARFQKYACWGSSLKKKANEIVGKLCGQDSRRVSEAATMLDAWAASMRTEARNVGSDESNLRLCLNRMEVAVVVQGDTAAALLASLKLALRGVYRTLFRRAMDRVTDNAPAALALFTVKYQFWAATVRLVQSASTEHANGITPQQKKDAMRFCASQLELLLKGVSRNLNSTDLKQQVSLRRIASYIPAGRLSPGILQYLREHGPTLAARLRTRVDGAAAAGGAGNAANVLVGAHNGVGVGADIGV